MTHWWQSLIPIRACWFVSKRLKKYRLANYSHSKVAILFNGFSMSALTGFERRFSKSKFGSRVVIITLERRFVFESVTFTHVFLSFQFWKASGNFQTGIANNIHSTSAYRLLESLANTITVTSRQRSKWTSWNWSKSTALLNTQISSLPRWQSLPSWQRTTLPRALPRV